MFAQDKTVSETIDELEISRGPIYVIGIVAFVFSAVNAIIVSASYQHARDGIVLLYAKGASHSGMVSATAP